MAAVDLLAGTVMDKAASLMNDSARTVYTYVAQVPYLNIALQELQEEFELNAIPATEEVSAVIQMDAGDTEIIYNGVGVPTLPSDMVEPAQLWERTRGIDPFIPMTKKDYLPHNLEGVKTNQFIYYVWQAQKIKVLPSNADNDIKIDYIRQLFTPVVNEFSFINVINAATFLEYRTAGLLAEFIERNLTSANSLNAYAVLAMNRALGIGNKGKQNIMTRRRPFRANYKRRGWLA
jgi:hypothetical protein